MQFSATHATNKIVFPDLGANIGAFSVPVAAIEPRRQVSKLFSLTLRGTTSILVYHLAFKDILYVI